MKKVFMVLMVLALAGSMVFAQLSLANTSLVEFGNTLKKDSGVGLALLRNESNFSAKGEKFSVAGRVRVNIEPIYAGERKDFKGVTVAPLLGWGPTKSIKDFLRLAAYFRPFAGFEVAAGNYITGYNVGTQTAWADNMDAQADAFWKDVYYPLEYAKTGVAVKYSGVPGLEIGLAFPADDAGATLVSGEYVLSFKLNAGVKYTIAKTLSLGVAGKFDFTDGKKSTNVGQQFAFGVSYIALPVGPINAFVSYNTPTKAVNVDQKNSHMGFGVNANLKFGDLIIQPDLAAMLFMGDGWKNKVPVSGGAHTDAVFAFYGNLNVAYNIGAMTPALLLRYSQGAAKEKASTYFRVQPKFAYRFAAGTLNVEPYFDLRSTAGDVANYGSSNGESILRWTAAISWVMTYK